MAVEPVAHDPRAHPFLRGVAAIAVALEDARAVRPDLLSIPEKERALLELVRLESELAGLKLRVLGCAEDVAAEHGARDAAAWLAHEALLDRGPARRDGDLATALTERWARLESALVGGAINLPQARACVEVLGELPADLDTTLVDAVEEQLVALAADWAPKDLRLLGRKILEAIDPEAADAHEARTLEEAERRAYESTGLSFTRLGNGSTRVSAQMPDAAANRLATYLDAFTSPRHQSAAGSEPPVSSPESRGPIRVQRGRAFLTLLEHLDPARLPAHGGDATAMLVTIGVDELAARLAVATVVGHDVGRISASEARRLACSAQLIPAVLDSESEVLDLGRTSRLFSRAQRKALRIRDQRCRAEGCGVPAAWTEAHHKDPWAGGGPTDLANGICLCSFHHHRAHDDAYTTEYLPNGDVRHRRRT
jgi:hypothetical protein